MTTPTLILLTAMPVRYA